MDHVNRVLEPALKFAQKENANKDIVSLLALFHNVAKYKLFGMDNVENVSNIKKIVM
ncbi:hypothetical protein [Thomasclavelia sp.]|uniref:hypothetical protein n=1 Tax=Thomasclavelia sp. TaxID=3025757 RepID=UPI0025F068EB|nr:hypothetical protein [Thomasclavelia sp.]